MPKYLVLPKIGLNMEEGVITEWLIKPGDRVEKEQMVVQAETDKAIQDLFATESGIVYKLLVQPGDVVKCQERIAMLLDEGEKYVKEDAQPETAAKASPPEVLTVQASSAEVLANAPRASSRISPLAKKIASEMGISIADLKPAREGLRIVKADVLAYMANMKQKSAFPAESEKDTDTFVPFTRKRGIIAKHMLGSANNKPRVSLVTTVDCERLWQWRERLKIQYRVTFNELIVKVCATALSRHPEMNRISQEGGYRIMKSINIGVAVDNPDGLVVPVIKQADKKAVFQLAAEFSGLVEKVKSGSASLDDLSGGTFTITNLGMFGVESFDPIINSPECLILGVGCIKDTPAVIGGEVCIRKSMQISLCFDHTVFDGASAAKLLKKIKDLIEDPIMMLA
jgi:pyruvate dehydrogenase E2 component (dihydrolipoamide acetyltransferase)